MPLDWITFLNLFFSKTMYCEIIINCGVLIFADFVIHSNNENENPTIYNFSLIVACKMFETMNSRTHGSMHFVKTTKIGADE
jgi:hypothetical protein